MSDVKDKYLLRTQDGKFLTVKNEELCAVERQSPHKNGTNVFLMNYCAELPVISPVYQKQIEDTRRNNVVNKYIFIDISPSAIYLFYNLKSHPIILIVP